MYVGSKKYFIDTYSSTDLPRIILLKELKTGALVRVLEETDLDQYIEYEWSNPRIVQFPTLDGSTILYGTLILPPNYEEDKKLTGFIKRNPRSKNRRNSSDIDFDM